MGSESSVHIASVRYHDLRSTLTSVVLYEQSFTAYFFEYSASLKQRQLPQCLHGWSELLSLVQTISSGRPVGVLLSNDVTLRQLTYVGTWNAVDNVTYLFW